MWIGLSWVNILWNWTKIWSFFFLIKSNWLKVAWNGLNTGFYLDPWLIWCRASVLLCYLFWNTCQKFVSFLYELVSHKVSDTLYPDTLCPELIVMFENDFEESFAENNFVHTFYHHIINVDFSFTVRISILQSFSLVLSCLNME